MTSQQSLRRRVERLEQRLVRLQDLNRRFSWYRLGAFCLGVICVWLAAVNLSSRQTWLVVLGAVLFFAGVVALHRRLDGWTARFTIWKDIYAGQLARLCLDWGHISAAPLPPSQARCSLDIDLDLTGPRSLHQLIDLAVSQEGSQRLADWLRQAHPDPEQIVERQQIVREMAALPRFRQRLLLNLRLISAEQLKGERLMQWLAVDYPSARLKWLLLIGGALAALNALLFGLNLSGKMPAYWPVTLVIYQFFYFANVGLLGGFLDAVVRMDSELDKFRALLRHLETYPYGHKEHLARLCAPFRDPRRRPSAQLRRIKWVTAAAGLRMNPIVGFLVNLVLPWDFTFAFLAGRLRQQASQSLPVWLETWYQLEALCSLAGFAALHPEYTYPEIAPSVQPVFRATALGHPLILAEHKVCNDFAIPGMGEVNLITGSNMAGKSTFIKTVGINLCLAYAGGPVNAASLCCAPLRLHTCIRITDSISDGFSYFYAEVKCLRHLLEELRSDDPLPVLYLIDEIFRGTNNRERLLGSRAYIQALAAAPGCGLIATHDLEMAGLAGQNPHVKNFHFRDEVQDGRLVFDYKIRPGPSPTTNALKIMAMEGLPT